MNHVAPGHPQYKEPIRKIEQEFTIKVLVDVRMKNVPDVNLKGEEIFYQTRQIFLVPQVSTQATQFFDAWLPAVNINPVTNKPEWPEIAVQLSHPFTGYVRGAVMRKSNDYPTAHHIVLMSSEDKEEALASMKGKYLVVKIMPDSQAERLLS